ncbi:uncharacterized protein LOC124991347 [Sciurus carolinensis]|uniref:uncharacterized protein LOC124991347 n=1 Tax=Sciurus carolinensis TaxID=30640 RepID=UPI001FB3D8C0|nr:uncharacterized protein LOC124991347 [Sciurus carolinensis]
MRSTPRSHQSPSYCLRSAITLDLTRFSHNSVPKVSNLVKKLEICQPGNFASYPQAKTGSGGRFLCKDLFLDNNPQSAASAGSGSGPRPGSAARPGPLGAGWAPTLSISRDGGRAGDPKAWTPPHTAWSPRCSGTARPGRTGAAWTPLPPTPPTHPSPTPPPPALPEGSSRGPEISASAARGSAWASGTDLGKIYDSAPQSCKQSTKQQTLAPYGILQRRNLKAGAGRVGGESRPQKSAPRHFLFKPAESDMAFEERRRGSIINPHFLLQTADATLTALSARPAAGKASSL